ncbi:exosortase K [Pedobacter terrae]|uniref:Exosortase K n=1 Tax=Pedobacter terrae TaxID=405671 RepID=A0A1G7V0K2_9SPHI|nr:exosortase K [Pedobacter terrae]SDG53362.1 exosortase K [Pedobacter terrae]
MEKNRSAMYYLFGILLFACFKLAYTTMDAERLSFLLSPTDYLVSKLNNSNGRLIEHLGYYHQDLNITIEKSCSGFNFFSLSFLITYCLSISYLKCLKLKWIALTSSLLFSWILTIFVNTSRISSSIFIANSINIPKQHQALVHQAEGTFIYLFFLILSYKLIDHLLKTYAVQYENPA